MNEATTIRFVGLDFPRDSIASAVAQRDGKPAEALATVPNDVAAGRLGSVFGPRFTFLLQRTGVRRWTPANLPFPEHEPTSGIRY